MDGRVGQGRAASSTRPGLRLGPRPSAPDVGGGYGSARGVRASRGAGRRRFRGHARLGARLTGTEVRRGAPRHPAARRPPGGPCPPWGSPSGVRRGAASTAPRPAPTPRASGTASQKERGEARGRGSRLSQRHDVRRRRTSRRTTSAGRTLGRGVTRSPTTNLGTRQSIRNNAGSRKRWRPIETRARAPRAEPSRRGVERCEPAPFRRRAAVAPDPNPFPST